MISNADKEATPLDPIYAISTKRINNGQSVKLDTRNEDYNRWRRSLPEHCWNCKIFDSCYPKRQCKHNPNCK